MPNKLTESIFQDVRSRLEPLGIRVTRVDDFYAVLETDTWRASGVSGGQLAAIVLPTHFSPIGEPESADFVRRVLADHGIPLEEVEVA